MSKVLTSRAIDALKPKERQYDVRDAALPGLILRVNANGTKTWSLIVFRSAKRQRVTIGMYPEISLSEARRKASERKKVGIRRTGSVEYFFNEYLAEIKPTRRSWKDVECVGRLYFLPLFGNRMLDSITAEDGVEMLDLVQRKKSKDRAAKSLAYLRPFFKWAAGRKRYISVNPWSVLVPPESDVRARERVLTNDELSKIWEFASNENYPFGPYLQTLILTAQRRSEVGGLQWIELDSDRQNWTIPSNRHKKNRVHELPFSNACWDIICSLPNLGDFVFTTTRRSPISGFGKFKTIVDKKTGVTDWRLHDIRRTAATRMAEMEVPRFIIARVLGHVDSSVTADYDRATYRTEKREALETWSEFVLGLTPPK
jgi:integrase